MKPIEAQEQVRLGPTRCLQLALSGMVFRLFRSGITTAILALAVAFLVHMVVYGLMTNQIQARAYEQLQASRQLGQVLTRLAAADSQRAIIDAMAAGDAAVLPEYRVWSGATDAAFDRQVATAQAAMAFKAYLDSLPVAARAAMVGDKSVYQVLDDLEDPQAFDALQDKGQTMALPEPPGGWNGLRQLAAQDWPALQELVERIHQGHQRAVADLQAAVAPASVTEAAIEKIEAMADAAEAQGFVMPRQRLDELQRFARQQQDLAVLGDALDNRRVRQAILQNLEIPPEELSIDEVLAELDSSSQAQWFEQVMVDTQVSQTLEADRLQSMASSLLREQQLEAAVSGYNPGESGLFGLPTRTLWLIGLSFLVCAVGVANAMLMSVTERFTEIATMKCLGAMDLFVMMMFVFEAMMQGLIGGIVGLLLGVILALLRGLIEYGGLLGTGLGIVGEILLASLLSLLAGIVLATVAAIGPSWVAARLAPMEAMRVD